MLNTDSCGYLIGGASTRLDNKVAAVRPQSSCISVITQAELLFGVERKGRPPKLTSVVTRFLQKIPSLPWEDECARHYSQIRAGLESEGRLIGNLDLLIAAHALAIECVLVTNNERHFKQVPGLTVENWST